MPILVRHNHLLNYLLDIFISSLNCPIHLRPVRRGIMVLDFEILTHLFHHLVVRIGSIIGDNFPGQPISTNYLLLMNLITTLLVTLAYEAVSTHLVK